MLISNHRWDIGLDPTSFSTGENDRRNNSFDYQNHYAGNHGTNMNKSHMGQK